MKYIYYTLACRILVPQLPLLPGPGNKGKIERAGRAIESDRNKWGAYSYVRDDACSREAAGMNRHVAETGKRGELASTTMLFALQSPKYNVTGQPG